MAVVEKNLLPDETALERVASEAADPSRTSAQDNSRASRRYPHDLAQRMAPVRGRRLPAPTMFCVVQCRDISQGGISFLARESPDFDHTLITLGDEPAVCYMLIKIVGCVLVHLTIVGLSDSLPIRHQG